MKKYEIARTLAEEALLALAIGDKKSASAPELLSWVNTYRSGDYSAVKSSWPQFLTRMVDDPESKLTREPGSYGYKLSTQPDHDTVEVGGNDDLAVTEAPELRVSREGRLYGLLAEWLRAKEYSAGDTSTAKRGGPWGNPDVVGIRLFEGYSSTLHIELVSIEAKLTNSNWRRVFFEAVSHKRFADRAYFVFSYGSDEPTVSRLPDLQEMRQYGEKYGVGVLVIFMKPDLHKKLCESSANEIPIISLEDVRIEEVWPAMSDPVPATTRERFIREVLEIENTSDLYAFGC